MSDDSYKERFAKIGYVFREALKIPFPSWASKRILEDLPNMDAKLIDDLQDIWEIQEDMTDLIREAIMLVKSNAKKEGVAVKAAPVCCHRETCGVCLGKYSTHYPYFHVRSMGKGNGYEGWRLVRTRDVRAFLGKYGMDTEKIRDFEQLVYAREYLLSLYNYAALYLNHIGLAEKVV